MKDSCLQSTVVCYLLCSSILAGRVVTLAMSFVAGILTLATESLNFLIHPLLPILRSK